MSERQSNDTGALPPTAQPAGDLGSLLVPQARPVLRGGGVAQKPVVGPPGPVTEVAPVPPAPPPVSEPTPPDVAGPGPRRQAIMDARRAAVGPYGRVTTPMLAQQVRSGTGLPNASEMLMRRLQRTMPSEGYVPWRSPFAALAPGLQGPAYFNTLKETQ